MRRAPGNPTAAACDPPLARAAHDGLRSAACPRERFLRIVESLSIFLVGAAVMNYLYVASAAQPGQPLGVPEHDSFYHVRMATLLVEQGLPQKFPWLQYAYFRESGDDFVSHHVGFHALLAPLVLAARAITGDALDGGRWAVCAFFGANLLLFDLLLRRERVPLRWLWLAVFLVLPNQFLSRHASVRAIGASLMFMQLILLALFAGRHWLAAAALAAYVHLYLGAVTFGPPLVIAYALAQAVGPRGERCLPWRMALITFVGWLVGVLTYPYASGMFEFLRLQVFGSGLSPETEVGNEWRPYTDAWFIVMMSGGVLAIWVAALTLRLRCGPRLNPRETAILLLQFGFLLLTLKARRFIEYWPPFCLLSAAYLAAPPLRAGLAALRAWCEPTDAPSARRAHVWAISLSAAAIVSSLVLGYFLLSPLQSQGGASGKLLVEALLPGAAAVVAEWRVWLCLLVVFAGAPLARAALGGGRLREAWIGALVLGGAVGLIGAVAAARSEGFPAARIEVSGLMIGAVVLAVVLIALIASRLRAADEAASAAARAGGCLRVILGGAIACGVVLLGAPQWSVAAGAVRCRYDLKAVADVMRAAQQASRAGDIIFTDDWDVFPPFFYFNTHNYFIVGLDPEFTHARRPELWDRYVKISRGQTPATIRVSDGGGKTRAVRVELSDIWTEFRARFVVTDLDHNKLAAQLAAAPDFAELIYPAGGFEANKQAPYLLFRIRAPHDAPATGPSPASARSATPAG